MDRVGRWVGPYEVVARAWVPEPGIWYAGRGAGEDPVLMRFGAPARPDELEELQRQHAVLRGLDDPRLPEAVAYDEGEGALVVRGGVGATLADAIALRAAAEVALTPGTLVDLLLEVGGALAAVHGAGEVHGHLDPRDVVLEENGAVWLYGVGSGRSPSAAFLAPELARGQAATPATDQWALGALGLALVLGHPPWRSDDPRAEAVDGDLTRAVEAVARQWPALGHLLGRMVASDPAARFPAVEQAADALAELATLAGPSERESLGAALASVPRPPLIPDDGAGGAPTAVPATDHDDRPSVPWGSDGDEETPIGDDDTDDRVVVDGLGAFASPWPVRPAAGDEGEDEDEDEARPELTDPIGWFQTPTPAASWSGEAPTGPRAAVSPRDPRRAEVTRAEISLASEAPVPAPPSTANLWIVRLAPLLAGVMVVLLAVWLVVQLL